MDNSPKLRLFVDQPLAQGAVISLEQAQTHYLVDVMRARQGTTVALFNGKDGEWQARICQIGKRAAQLSVETALRAQSPEPDLWLLFAPIKRVRVDTVVEKATELGVSVLQPVFTNHTAMTRVNEERLAAIAIEAAEQCERLTVPLLRPAQSLSAVLTTWPIGRRLIVLDEGGGGQPIGQALAQGPMGPAAVLVGPEGGFAKSELDGLRALSFATPVGLGPRILRADTAAIAALACFQALGGDWCAPPPVRPKSIP